MYTRLYQHMHIHLQLSCTYTRLYQPIYTYTCSCSLPPSPRCSSPVLFCHPSHIVLSAPLLPTTLDLSHLISVPPHVDRLSRRVPSSSLGVALASRRLAANGHHARGGCGLASRRPLSYVAPTLRSPGTYGRRRRACSDGARRGDRDVARGVEPDVVLEVGERRVGAT